MNEAKKNRTARKMPGVRRASVPPAGAVVVVPVAPPVKRGRGRPRKTTALSVAPAPTVASSIVAGPSRTAAPVAQARSALKRATRRELHDLIFGCERGRNREGARVAVLAATRHGKTHLIREFVGLGGDCLTMIHDVAKIDPQYLAIPPRSGCVVSGVQQMALVPESADTITFRGDVIADQVCDVESVAALALAWSRSRVPVRLVVDELEQAVTPGGKKLVSESLLKIGVQGGQLGLTLIWSTQIPQRAPSDALTQCSAVVLGRLEAQAINYLDGTLYFDREMTEALGTLQVGEFVVRIPGQPWDRVIYS